MSILLIVDTETSGTSPDDSDLLEVAVATYDLEEGALIDCVSWLVAGENKPDALAINGISNALLAKYTAPGARVSSDALHSIWRGHTHAPIAIVAHEAEFDRQWFTSDVRKLPWACSRKDIEWPRRAQMGSGSLEKLALAHGVGVLPGHRAIHDVLTLVRVFDAVYRSDGAGPMIRMMQRAVRPKARYQAIVSFGQKDLAYDEGFTWDGKRKIWWKDIAIEDVPVRQLEYPFKIVRTDS